MAAPKAAARRLVERERKLLPKLGTRKLYYMLENELKAKGIKCGRDKLFSWLREDGLLIKPPKRYIRTTDSRHRFKKYPNIVKGILLSAPEQLWVSDITYLRTLEGWMFLGLVTDAYSRKIMGYSIADNMEAATVAGALRMALENRNDINAKPVHHSDRGIQYCSKEYIALADVNSLPVSMTENGDPYENALAERMNRTLKEEFGLGEVLPSKNIVPKMVQEAVFLYNTRRPHLSLKMQTPDKIHKKIPATEAAEII